MTFLKKPLLVFAAALCVLTIAATVPADAQTTVQFITPLAVGAVQTQSVTVAAQASGSIGQIQVLTQGKAGGDYTQISGGNCSVGMNLMPAQSCTVQVQFQPTAPGPRLGAVVLLDTGGALIGTRLLYGTGTGSEGVLIPANMATVAGNGTWVYRGDALPAIFASIFLPGGVAIDGLGNVFLSDTNNNRVRRVDAQSGEISTVAGNGSPGDGGDNGPATLAGVNLPSGMLIDGAGNVLFADSGNNAVRKLTLATGVLSTIAGQLGQQGNSGDNGPATAALLNAPEGIALDRAGNLYIADTLNNVVRRVDAGTGIITTVAGNGTANFSGDGGLAVSATLNSPQSVAVDATGALVIADLLNNRIRRVTAGGTISTVAGTGATAYSPAQENQPATAANLKGPAAMALDVAGNMYVADSGNNRIRKIAAGTGLITSVAGTGAEAFEGDGGPATSASMYGPYALAIDSRGNVFFSDLFNNRIRELQNSLVNLTYPDMRVGRASLPQGVTFENDGNATMNITGVSPDGNSTTDSATTTCSVAVPLAIDAQCNVGAVFTPQVVGSPATATILLQSNASNSPSTLQLSGNVNALNPTTTVVTSSANPSPLGVSVTFTATTTENTPAAGDIAPSGNMRFYDGATLLATVSTGGTSTAQYSTSALALGSHAITAAFTGDAQNSPSTSAVLTQVIKQTPNVTIASNVNPSQVGGGVVFTANVSGTSVAPSGVVTFSDAGTVLGNGTLNGGVATFPYSGLTAGTHQISANYLGDTNTLPGSATVAQVVNKWSTTTTMGTSSTPATVGAALTFTIQVTPTSAVVPAGSVILTDGGNPIATLTLNGQGVTSYTTSTLTLGSHVLVATFQGDPTNDVSASAALTQVIQTVSTAVTLVSSANPANAGATLQLTATVSGSTTNSTAGNPTGTVTFTEGGTTLGSSNVSASGVAAVGLNSLAVGSHTILASYVGDPYHAASSSTALIQVVQLATTAVQLVASANPTIAGRTMTLTAAVSGNGGIPAGTITFLDGGASIGTGTLNASGQATLTLASLHAGTHTLVAAYGGDARDAQSASMPLAEVVQQSVTSIALTSNANPSFAGAAVVFTASLTATGGLPTGQIVLHEGGTVLGSTAINGAGVVSFSLSSLAAGSHTLVASFAGDADHAASNSAGLVQVVQIGTSLVGLTSSHNPSVFGDAVVFTVNVSGTANQPTGTVTLMDGGTAIASLTLNAGGAATFSTTTLSIGDHVITGVYGGDTTHAGSTSRSVTERVQQATSVTVLSSKTPSVVGDVVQFTATVKGVSGAPISGTVSFADVGTVLGVAPVSGGVASISISTLTAGIHLMVATYSGDATNIPATSAGLAQTVNTAGTSVTLTSSANPSVVGSAVKFSAAVASLGKVPTGTVSFKDGTLVIGTGVVTNGVATFQTSSLTAGQHVIVADYSGDAGTQASTSSLLLQVAQQRTTLALASSVNPALTLQGIVLTAAVGNGAHATGVVTFTDGGATIGSVALGANGAAVLSLPSLAAGSHTLAASYAGDAYNLPSVTAPLTQVVQLRATSTSTTASSDTYLQGGQVTLIGVVSSDGPVAPTGTVTFTSGGNSLGSAQLSPAGAATVTIFPLASSYDIVATYAGDAVYAGSTGATYTIKEGPISTFTMTPSTNTLSMASGTHGTFDLNIASVKGFTDILAMGCLELPIDATCTFSVDKVTLAANGVGVVHLTVDTGDPLGAGAQAKAVPGSASRSIQMALLPGAALLVGLLGWRRRHWKMPRLLALLALVAIGSGLSGCANNKLVQNATPAGTYTIRVVASGTQSGASQVVDMPLTVTQ